jgi:hypothetical protein
LGVQAAAELAVSESTVGRWLASGILYGERFGPRLVRVDLDRFSGVPVSPMLSSEDQWVAGVLEEMREG